MRAAADPPAPLQDAVTLVLFGTCCTLAATLGGGLAGVDGSLDPSVALAIVAMAVASRRPVALGPRDRVVLCLSSATALAPDGRLAMLGLTAGALALLRPGMRATHGPLGALWLATAWHVLWAKVAFKLVSPAVIALETPAVAAVGRLAFPGLAVDGTRIANGAWYIHVVEGCSAFHGISLAALSWLSAAGLSGARLDGRLWAGLAAGCLGVVALNVGRIVAMLPSREAYEYWHSGPGGLAVVALTAAFGAIPAVALARSR